MITQADDVPVLLPLVDLPDLFRIAAEPGLVAWEPFRNGVRIHWLYGRGDDGPSAALIRYDEAGTVPMHVHDGHEHILVLAGSQTDQAGTLNPGTLRVHPPGSRHSITSQAGCIVLAIYNKPVRFVEDQCPGQCEARLVRGASPSVV